MQPPRRPDSDRSFEILETRLRTLPQPHVPGDLEARILAAIPVATLNDEPRSKRVLRRWRLGVGAGASIALAAACLLAVRFWPDPSGKNSSPSVVTNPQRPESSHPVTPQQRSDSRRTSALLTARFDLDETALPTYNWPIQEKSPLMVSSALRPDLLD